MNKHWLGAKANSQLPFCLPLGIGAGAGNMTPFMASDSAPEAAKPLQPSRRNEWLFVLALLAVTLAAYYPAWFGKPVWDDDAHLTSPELSSWTGLWRIWTEPGATQQYYPLVHSVFWLEYKIWGYSTPGYHFVNILLHVLCAVLLWKILRKLQIPGAWLAAAIFALHPVEVESVAWISELKNTLSGAFYLCAALVYLRFDRNRSLRLYLIAIGLFFLGLFCKTVIATFPAAMLVVFWWKRGKLSWKEDVWPLIPFFALGIGMGLFTAYMEKKFIIGGEGGAFNFTAVERCLIAGRAFWFYTCKLLWPAKLVFIYHRWNVTQGDWRQYLFPAAALALLGSLWMLRKRTRAPLAAALFFGGTLFPALGFVNVYPFIFSFVADHFQYLAGIGVITLASAGAALLWEKLAGWQRWAGSFFIAAVLALLAGLTWRQCGTYANARTLYMRTIAQNPDCWMAWNNLGTDLLAGKQVDAAIACFHISLKIKPDYPKSENDLGKALFIKNGNIAEARAHFEKALKFAPGMPEANINLGNLLLRTGHVDEAIAHYKTALELLPDSAAAHNGLGDANLEQGKWDDALAEYQQSLELQPGLPQAADNIGNVLLHKGRVNEAISYYQKALQIDPDYVPSLNSLAWLLATADSSVRNGAKAVELAENANRLSGGDKPGILYTLAAAYAEAGRFPDATATAEHALSLATAAHDTVMVNALNMELKLYRARMPYHQTSL